MSARNIQTHTQHEAEILLSAALLIENDAIQ